MLTMLFRALFCAPADFIKVDSRPRSVNASLGAHEGRKESVSVACMINDELM